MPLPSFYNVGTASVSNGATTITFASALLGTEDNPAFIAGDLFMDPAQPLVPPQRIASIDYDAEEAELAVPWPGTSMTDDPYEVRYIGDSVRSAAQNRRYLEMAGQLVALGIQPDAFGELVDRDAYDDAVKDFIFLSLNGDAGATTTAWTLYTKLSSDDADWSAGQSVEGPQGEPGLIGDWKGPWVTATAYAVDDAVSEGGSSYICIVAHTSGTFATDLAAAKWQLVASKGDTGATGSAGSNGIFSSIASKAEAQAGAETTKGMNALRTREAMQAGAGAAMRNGKLSASVGSSALTVALKTLAGTDPSATDVLSIPVRNTSGGIDWLDITAAASIVISSGSTLGVPASTQFRIWIVAFNDGGGLRLGVINCLSGTEVCPLADGLAASSSVDSGSGNADSAHTFYTTGAGATNKAYTILGYLDWDTGLGTPGTWSAGPDRTVLFGAGMKRPGDRIQVKRSVSGSRVTGTTLVPFDNTVMQNTEGTEFLTSAITPTAKQSVLRIAGNLYCGSSVTNNSLIGIFQDATASALAMGLGPQIAAGAVTGIPFEHFMKAGTISSTTFKLRAGGNAAGNFDMNGTGGGAVFNGSLASELVVEEIMA